MKLIFLIINAHIKKKYQLPDSPPEMKIEREREWRNIYERSEIIMK